MMLGRRNHHRPLPLTCGNFASLSSPTLPPCPLTFSYLSMSMMMKVKMKEDEVDEDENGNEEEEDECSRGSLGAGLAPPRGK